MNLIVKCYQGFFVFFSGPSSNITNNEWKYSSCFRLLSLSIRTKNKNKTGDIINVMFK